MCCPANELIGTKWPMSRRPVQQLLDSATETFGQDEVVAVLRVG